MMPAPIQWTQLSFVSWGRNSVSEDSSPCSSGTSLKSLRTFRALRPLRALSRFEGIKVKIRGGEWVWVFIWIRVFNRYWRSKNLSGKSDLLNWINEFFSFISFRLLWMHSLEPFLPSSTFCSSALSFGSSLMF